MPRILAAVLIVLVAAPAAAQPLDARAVRNACLPDIRALCADVQPGGGRLILCLDGNRAKLSPACAWLMPPSAAIRARLGAPAG